MTQPDAGPRPPVPIVEPDPPLSTWPILAGAATLLLGLALVRAVLQSGLAGPAAAWVAGAGLLVVAGTALAVWFRGPVAETTARVVVVLALGAVSAQALVVVALAGRHAVADLGVVAVAVLAGLVLANPRWLAVLAGALSAASLGVLFGAVAPSAWPAPVAVLVLACATAALLETGRHRQAGKVARALDAHAAVRATDPLTGLASRRGLSLVATRMIESARRQGDAVHCLFVEVGGLDRTVGRLGPTAVDDVLVAAAGAVSSAIRGTDVAARWDDRLFCVVGPGVGVSPYDLERRIRDALARHPAIPPEDWTPAVTAAAASLAPWDSGNLGTLLALCEQELYVRRVLRGSDAPARRAADGPA
ncbi:MAG: GGDEF domain-containing protein [Actinomycetes bacterium]